MQIVRVIRCHFVALLVLAGLVANGVNAGEFLGEACEDVTPLVADVHCLGGAEGVGCSHTGGHPRGGSSSHSSSACTCAKIVQAVPRQNVVRAGLRKAEVAGGRVFTFVQSSPPIKPMVVHDSLVPSLPHVLVRTVILQT